MSNTDEQNKTKEGGQGNEDKGEKPVLFDEWLKAQPADVKTLLDTHTAGLKSALDSEREQRKDFEKQLRDAGKKLKEGSDERKSLEDMADQVARSNKKADFYDAAHTAGVTNLRLAFMAAEETDLFDRRGNVNFEQLKKQFPELFTGIGDKPPPGMIGQGTRTKTPVGFTMNDFIRQSTGRK